MLVFVPFDNILNPKSLLILSEVVLMTLMGYSTSNCKQLPQAGPMVTCRFFDAWPLSGCSGSGWLSLFVLEKGWDINVIMKYMFYYFEFFPACVTRAKKTQTLRVLLDWVKLKKPKKSGSKNPESTITVNIVNMNGSISLFVRHSLSLVAKYWPLTRTAFK